MHELKDRCVDGWMDGWMNGWVEAMKGRQEREESEGRGKRRARE